MLKLPQPSVLLSAALLAAFAPAGDSLTFHPADGSQAAKAFELSGSFELGDLTLLVDGQDMTGDLPPMDDASGSFSVALSIVDHYVKIADGRPLELHRDYVSSKSEWKAAENSGSDTDAMELDGKTVVFKWNAEKDAYDRSFKDGAGDEAKLDGLGVDLDYRSLLPGSSVAAGERWSIDAKALGAALLFGTDFEHLPAMDEGGEELAMLKDKVLPQLEKLLEGFKAECEFVGTREVDGAQVAAIKLHLDSDSSMDMSSMLEDLIRAQIEGQEMQVDFDIKNASLSAKIKGEGELLWDAKLGRAHAFEMEADVEFGVELDVSIDAEGEAHSLEASAEVLGKANWGMSKGE